MITTNRVRFADDCGKQLIYVEIIPCHNTGRHVSRTKKKIDSVNFCNKDLKFYVQYKDSIAMKRLLENISRIEKTANDISEKILNIIDGKTRGDVFELCNIREELYVMSDILSKKRDDTLKVVLSHTMSKYT